MDYKVGDKIKFTSEKQRYTIRACDERYLICTKPFNARKTFLYTIVDLKEKKRSSDNWYCKYDYTSETEALKGLEELNKGIIELSTRRAIDLDFERIDAQ